MDFYFPINDFGWPRGGGSVTFWLPGPTFHLPCLHILVTLFTFSPDRLQISGWRAQGRWHPLSNTLTFNLPCINRVTPLCASRLTYPAHHFPLTRVTNQLPCPTFHVPWPPSLPHITPTLFSRVTHLCDPRSHQVPLTFHLPGPRYLLTNDLPCAGTWSFSHSLPSHLTYPVLVI